MASVTLKITNETLKKMDEFYASSKIEGSSKPENYILWQAKTIDDVVITIYSSSKGLKALFNGPSALNESHIWDENASLNVSKPKLKAEWLYLDDQIGSDEVGTGDFFGPVVVVASYVKASQLDYLRRLGVDDSKRLTDKKIKEIAPKLMEEVIYIKQVCPNTKYNEQIELGQTMNSIKALLHNNALLKVRNKVGNEPCFVDQFCDVDKYYSYLQNQKQIVNTNITFKTKGETYYPSVAVSSIIARSIFLDEIDAMSAALGVTIPLGASLKVDEVAKIISRKIGKDKLKDYIKINFVNYKNL
jgi:ribonuclease HIII